MESYSTGHCKKKSMQRCTVYSTVQSTKLQRRTHCCRGVQWWWWCGSWRGPIFESLQIRSIISPPPNFLLFDFSTYLKWGNLNILQIFVVHVPCWWFGKQKVSRNAIEKWASWTSYYIFVSNVLLDSDLHGRGDRLDTIHYTILETWLCQCK